MLKPIDFKLNRHVALLCAAAAMPLLSTPLSAAAGCLACACKMQGAAKPATNNPVYPREMELKVGQTRTFAGGLTVNFVGVSGDSRCPSDAECVWAGNARVSLRVRQGAGKVSVVELNTGLQPKQVSVGKLTVQLLGLTPQPSTTVKIDRRSYVAKIRVSPQKTDAIPAQGKWQPLYSGESWYREQAGSETLFKGTLQALPPQDDRATTLMRTNYYRLGGRMLYTGTHKNALLDSLIGKKVEIRGKAVDMELEGQTVNEIWPAVIRTID